MQHQETHKVEGNENGSLGSLLILFKLYQSHIKDLNENVMAPVLETTGRLGIFVILNFI